jgi:hypothetical protein
MSRLALAMVEARGLAGNGQDSDDPAGAAPFCHALVGRLPVAS